MRDFITSLHCSPDGKWLAYLLSGRKIMLHDLATGQDKELGDVSQRGDWNGSLAWTEDSATLLVGVTGQVGGSEVIAHPVTGATPYSVYTTATKIGNFAIGGGLLALTTDISRGGLARATLKPAAAPDLMDPANGFTWSPSFAPDGTLAFVSNRTGTNAIWLIKPGMTPSILFDAGMLELSHVRFSPDGSELLVISQTSTAATVRIMTRAGATVKTFDIPSVGLGLPSWMPDGKAVLIFDRRLLRTMLVPVQNPGQARPFAPVHWVGIAVQKQGIFATRADKPGIWKIDGGVRQISTIYPAFYYPPMAFRGDDILVPDFTSGEPARILAQPLSGAARLIAYAPGAKSGAFQSQFVVNPADGAIIYTALVQHDTNIDLLKLARH